MSHTEADLRARLFDTIDALKTNAITIEHAKAIGEISQVIINLEKVKVDHARVTDTWRNDFLAPQDAATLPDGITRIVQHRIGR